MNDSSLPELLYRFVAHYKWEPQHLGGSMKEFESRLRQQEVPLNFLLNAFFRFSSAATIKSILLDCGFPDPKFVSQNFALKFPVETKFTQPDALIESDDARIFIEVKVDSKVKFEQVQKYALLHAAMNLDKKKRPYLMFLTKQEFPDWWSPSKDRAAASDLHTFLHDRLSAVSGFDFLKKVPDVKTLNEYEETRRDVQFGAHTWQSFGKCIRAVSSEMTGSAAREIELRVIEDFISDLRKRRFVD